MTLQYVYLKHYCAISACQADPVKKAVWLSHQWDALLDENALPDIWKPAALYHDTWRNFQNLLVSEWVRKKIIRPLWPLSRLRQSHRRQWHSRRCQTLLVYACQNVWMSKQSWHSHNNLSEQQFFSGKKLFKWLSADGAATIKWCEPKGRIFDSMIRRKVFIIRFVADCRTPAPASLSSLRPGSTQPRPAAVSSSFLQWLSLPVPFLENPR